MRWLLRRPPRTPVAVDPGEEALDEPPQWRDHRSELIEVLLDGLHGNAGRGLLSLMILAAVCPYPLDEWEEGRDIWQQRATAIAVPNVGGMRLDQQAAAAMMGAAAGVHIPVHSNQASTPVGIATTPATQPFRYGLCATDLPE